MSLDLDDTLWPIESCIEAAESELHSWLVQHAPRLAHCCSVGDLRRWRDAVGREWTDRSHDFSALRRESIRRALESAGEDTGLTGPAFDVFLAARQRVTLFDDTAPALEQLARRYRLFAITNGNADLERTGVARWVRDGIRAGDVDAGKPDPRIFAAACERLGLAPHQILHVGDDPLNDVDGARRAGFYSAWVQRPGSLHAHNVCDAHVVVADLLQLARWLAG